MTQPLPDEQVSTFQEALEAAIRGLHRREGFQDTKQQFLDDLWGQIETQVLEQIPDTIAGFVRQMAANKVKAIINGDQAEMKRYLSLEGYTGRGKGHEPFNGELFEPGPIALRRKMVEAHADLIQNERIKDLEDQVSSLVDQVNKKDREIISLRDTIDQMS